MIHFCKTCFYYLTIIFVLIPVSCSFYTPRDTFSPPEDLKLAPIRRDEFVNAFLQGKWCDSLRLFNISNEYYLRKDDFCRVSRNYFLAWKLKRYIGIVDVELINKAQYYNDLGIDCSDPLILTPGFEKNRNLFSKQDILYRKLITEHKFVNIQKKLTLEKDKIYASVYGRKAAESAIQENSFPEAKKLIKLTLAIDGEHGWIIFLIKDWKLYGQIANDKEKKVITERIKRLKDLVRPCLE
ncbi:MAG: hypothetical protein GY710_00300 [Desulfobacteraceae bacterium]|nr:hypothetical protein [Desulfobacteraceae bacterium]